MAALEVFSNQYVQRLQERGMRIARGFNMDVARALHNGIYDPVIVEYTRDAERFATIEKTVLWYEQQRGSRVFYSLVDKAIQGVIWFGSSTSEYTDASTTFAIRMYESGRGQGLSGNFMEGAHEDFAKNEPGKDVWLRVQPGNDIAQELYTRHGYEIVHEDIDGIVMNRTLSDKS